MTDYLTEQEQVEQLKKLLKTYGIPALVGILIGIAIFYGWNYYQVYRSRVLSHASGVYDEMLTDRAQNNVQETQIQAEKLLRHYPATPYGEIAALVLAREAVNKQNYPEAIKQFTRVEKQGLSPSIRQVARLRLARLFLEQQKPEAALSELKKIEDQSYSGLIDEVRGDAYLAKNQTSEARQAYQQALQELPQAEEIRPLLQMKLNNLATTG
ncbi:MAG TPA: tetratricopeptide repeat protein [Gammaproteobacteria bacterium]|nr:tetratricopeptide repeat protein [Gammaproteobacteria bacterium]